MYRDQFRKCPCCFATLHKAGSVWACRDCAGMWIDASIFAEMLLTMQAPTPTFLTAEGGQPRNCPECQAVMLHVGAHGLLLDSCRKHGFWFDRDELAPLLEKVGNTPDRDYSFWEALIDFLELAS